MSRHSSRGGLGRYGIAPPTVVREPARNPDETVICPECGTDITDTKSAHQVISPEFVDDDLRRDYDGELLVFGWCCTSHQYDVVTPAHCSGAEADGYQDGWVGVKLVYTDETVRFVATPERELEERRLQL